MTDLHGPQGRSSRLDHALHSLLRTAPELEAAAVVSFDGLPMASALPPGMDEDRVAAMSAALLSLGDRAAQGLGRGDLSQVYVEGEHGTVFLVSADDEAVLVAVAGKAAKVGLMLFEVRRAAQNVAAALVADDREADIAEAAAEAAATAAAVAAYIPPPAQPAAPVADALPDTAEPAVAYEEVTYEEVTYIAEPAYDAAGYDAPAYDTVGYDTPGGGVVHGEAYVDHTGPVMVPASSNGAGYLPGQGTEPVAWPQTDQSWT
jgi:predicted regulator of Ras-like GTPase activity (Roadblock/LC7/MglB family)